MFNVDAIRKDFPILAKTVDGKRLVYLDSAATSQKPQQVIDAISDYYTSMNANVHRGIHTLSERATTAFESVRVEIKSFINANDAHEIIYTPNTTGAINLVAYSWGRKHVLPSDEIVLSPMEHHSNLVPWQILAAEREAKLVFLEMTENGEIDLQSAERLITKRTRMVAVTHMSNVLGTINPVAELAKIAHAKGAVILVDGAQSVPHLPVSVKEMDCDFLAFSLHKMLGPTGVGILWAKRDILEAMPPFLGGGDMISSVSREKSTWNELPWKFEAGTPNIADVIASGEAIRYLKTLDMQAVRDHEIKLNQYALKTFEAASDITLYGPRDATKRGGVFSFNLKDIHPHDLGQILSDQGVAIRAGHHCCQPLMKDLNVTGTARASFYIYNTEEEIDCLFAALKDARKVLGHVAL